MGRGPYHCKLAALQLLPKLPAGHALSGQAASYSHKSSARPLYPPTPPRNLNSRCVPSLPAHHVLEKEVQDHKSLPTADHRTPHLSGSVETSTNWPSIPRSPHFPTIYFHFVASGSRN